MPESWGLGRSEGDTITHACPQHGGLAGVLWPPRGRAQGWGSAATGEQQMGGRACCSLGTGQAAWCSPLARHSGPHC